MGGAWARVASGWFGSAVSEPVPVGPVLNWRILGKPGFVAIYLAALAGVNSLSDSGLQPIVIKFNRLDPLSSLEHIKWNSFSRVVASTSAIAHPFLWGPSPKAPFNAV